MKHYKNFSYFLMFCIVFSLFLIISLNGSIGAGYSENDYSDDHNGDYCNCDDITQLEYPIMKPDIETRNNWIENYNNAPKFSANKNHNFLFSINQNFGSNYSILSSIDYDPYERNQRSCGNCWVWAATGCLEVALNNQKNIKDRLSVQYLNSNFNDGNGSDWACCGGNMDYFCEFYNETKKCISWSNENASWQDKFLDCDDGQSNVLSDQIETVPFYGLENISYECIITQNVSNSTAISYIKAALNQGIAVSFSFYLPNDACWNDFFNFWDYENESEIYQIDKFNGIQWDTLEGGGHAVLCVGYKDTDQNNSYWVMLNSWGGPDNRPQGLFRINMSMNYSCKNPGLGYGNYSFYWEILNVTFNDIEVDDDGTADYTSIREAITNAPAGETIHVYNGTYNESIVIDKNLFVYGDVSTIIDASAGTGITITANNTILSSFQITNATTGIKLYNESFTLQNITVENNTLYSNTYNTSDYGICSVNVSNATFLGNVIFNNTNSTAIRLNQTTNSLIQDTTIMDNMVGISLCENSSNNTFLSNNFYSNKYNAFIIFVHGGQNNTILSNIFTGNDKNQTGNFPVIWIADAFNNFYRNQCENNNGTGCYCIGNELNPYQGAHHLVFDNNSFTNNSHGLYLFGSCNNTIRNNTIQKNNVSGILLKNNSQYNLINTNVIKNNTIVGINLSSTENNTIWNNRFNNTNNVIDNGINNWNISRTQSTNIVDGPYRGGNYWHDYTGVDSDGDGIGETPYCINLANNIYDQLPLTSKNYAPQQNSPLPANQSVDIFPPSVNWSIQLNDSDGDFLNWMIECNGESWGNTSDTNGSKNITLSGLINGSRYTVFVNVTDGICWTNASYWFTTQIIMAYVDDDYDDSTSGWNITHFDLIQKAVDNLTVNGSILVHDGTYEENLLINKSLTLQANDSSSPVIDGKMGVGLNISSNFTMIDNLCLRNCSTAVLLSNSSDYVLNNITVSNTSFESNTNGVVFDTSFDNQSVLIHHNMFYENNTVGVNVTTGSSSVNATRNFWGSIMGPTHNGNENGSGVLVTNNVAFNPWIGEHGGLIYQDQLQVNYTAGSNTMENISAITIANTIIMINTSSSTNVTIAKYDSSPDYLPNNLSTIGGSIDIEIEDESVVNWPINISIYYTSQNLIEAEVNEACLDGIYYFNRSLNNWTRYAQTGVNTTNTGVYEGYCWAEVCRGQLSPKTIGNRNNPPSQPSNPSPNATSGVSINPSLSLTVYDVDGNNLTVSFFDNQTDTEIDVDDNVSNGGVASITWSNRAYSTNYEWYVIVNDSKTEITSSVYEFSTRSRPSSPGSASSFAPPPGPTNPSPVADAGGPYHGYVNRSIHFDGSNSSDDGSLVNFSWDFGDGTIGFGMKPMHIYDSVGNYSVVLTVTDDNDSTGTNTTMVRVDAVALVSPIADANGPYVGVINNSIVLDGSGSFDSDGSIMNYTWMGGYNKTWYGENPKVSYPITGTFSIRLTVTDDDGLTDNDTTTVTVYVGVSVDIPDGFVIDTDDDGVFDSFFNESSKTVTTMQKTNDGMYLIDAGDGFYDTEYDPATGEVTPYSPSSKEDDGSFWLYVAIIIIVIIAIILFILFKMGILVIE